jgi:aspartate kinase
VALVVQKFGGTSVGSLDRIRNVARRAIATQRAGHRVVLIVSAMSGETNRLLGLAHGLATVPDAREMDALAATGEQVSAALTAIAIQSEGGKARSLLGHQVKVLTDDAFTKARIKTIDASKLFETVDRGEIAVVAGFQGADEAGNITTLGRGGSDTSAVAVAAAISADECEIYTDVDGVFSADPRIVPDARKLPLVSFEEMLEMAASGAGVLQLRSVEYARNHGVRIHCRSSFHDQAGTVVVGETETMEQPLITAVTHSTAEARVTLVGVPDQIGAAARIFEALAEASVNVDMIVQNEPTSAGGQAEISFTVPREDLRTARGALEPLSGQAFAELSAHDEMGKVSIVGAGMRSHPGVAAKVFGVLAEEGINIEMISTSPIKISCVIDRDRVERAVQVLHSAFELSGPGTVASEEPFKARGAL